MKEQIRKEMLQKRERHHSAGGHVNCLEIMDLFVRLPEFYSAKAVLLYAAKGSEVHTDGMIQSALSLGKKVALPLAKKETRSLEIYWISANSKLALGSYGILEPPALPENMAMPGEIDLVVVPGVSFDRRGHRIGYGMGYYDSFLSGMKCPKIGLAYEMQIVPHVPNEPHDVAVDRILTEKGIIECRSCAGDAKLAEPVSKKFRVAVLASGRGSDFQSIIDGVKKMGRCTRK